MRGTSPRFPAAAMRRGMYESFYLRTFSPHEPLGLWLRYTVHKAPGRPPRGSIWCVLFDARRGAPFMTKLTSERLNCPPGAWISVGENGTMGPAEAVGNCGEARWSLRFRALAPELRHLSPSLLYRTPLPRTKLTSPMPVASFDGSFELERRRPMEIRGWPGMVGHNWGAEHAERWIWLHGTGFEQDPDAWIDVGLGRLRLGGRLTPWAASGALYVGGARHRLGGLRRDSAPTQVSESATGCALTLAGTDGLLVRVQAHVPRDSAAGWRYADPDGGEHDVVNCSVAALKMTVEMRAAEKLAARAADAAGDGTGGRAAERGTSPRSEITLSTGHSGAYELGMREHDHGVAIAPFPDG